MEAISNSQIETVSNPANTTVTIDQEDAERLRDYARAHRVTIKAALKKLIGTLPPTTITVENQNA